MVTMVALLCAAGIAPADCTQENAIDSVAMSYAATEQSCASDSMMALAALAIQPKDGEYWKVVCTVPLGPAPVLVGKREDGDQVTAPVP